MESIKIDKTASGKGLWVRGNSRNHKEKMKEMGGKWNASQKSWVFSLNKQQELLDYFNLSAEEIGQEVKPDIKAEIKSEVKTKVKAEIKEEVKPDIKAEDKAEVKSEVKAEIKEVKPEVKQTLKQKESSKQDTNIKTSIQVGDYFQRIWSAVYYTSDPVTVVKVFTQSKVEVEIGEENTKSLQTITKRNDNIWREEGKKKEMGQGMEIGTRYIYTGKNRPSKTDTHPVMW